MQEVMNKLYSIFEELGYPHYRQGSLGDGPYQDDSFFTFWNITTEKLAYYDDTSHASGIEIQVYFYTNDFNIIYSEFDRLIDLLERNDFISQDNGQDVPSDYKTHMGRTCTVVYRKVKN